MIVKTFEIGVYITLYFSKTDFFLKKNIFLGKARHICKCHEKIIKLRKISPTLQTFQYK